MAIRARAASCPARSLRRTAVCSAPADRTTGRSRRARRNRGYLALPPPTSDLETPREPAARIAAEHAPRPVLRGEGADGRDVRSRQPVARLLARTRNMPAPPPRSRPQARSPPAESAGSPGDSRESCSSRAGHPPDRRSVCVPGAWPRVRRRRQRHDPRSARTAHTRCPAQRRRQGAEDENNLHRSRPSAATSRCGAAGGAL